MTSLPELAFSFARFVAREHRRSHLRRRTFGPAVARRRNSGVTMIVARTGTVASATAGRHFVALVVATILVVAFVADTTFAETTTVTGCSAAIPLKNQDQVPGQLRPGNRPWSCRKLTPFRLLPCLRLMQKQWSTLSMKMMPLPPTSLQTPKNRCLLHRPSSSHQWSGYWVDQVPDGWLTIRSATSAAMRKRRQRLRCRITGATGTAPASRLQRPPMRTRSTSPRKGYAPVMEFVESSAPVPVDVLPPGLAANPLPEVKKEEVEAAAPACVLSALPDLNLPAAEVKEEVEAAAPACVLSALPDLNPPAAEVEEEENLHAAPLLALPTPSPEARVLLRRFAASMAARPAGIRAGTWSLVLLGLSDHARVLRLDEASEGTSRR